MEYCKENDKKCMTAVILILIVIAINIILPWIAIQAIKEENKARAKYYMFAILFLNVMNIIQNLFSEVRNWMVILIFSVLTVLTSASYHLLANNDDYDNSAKLMNAVFGINLAFGIVSFIVLIFGWFFLYQ